MQPPRTSFPAPSSRYLITRRWALIRIDSRLRRPGPVTKHGVLRPVFNFETLEAGWIDDPTWPSVSDEETLRNRNIDPHGMPLGRSLLEELGQENGCQSHASGARKVWECIYYVWTRVRTKWGASRGMDAEVDGVTGRSTSFCPFASLWERSMGREGGASDAPPQLWFCGRRTR